MYMRNSLLAFFSFLALLIMPAFVEAQTTTPATRQQIQPLRSNYKQAQTNARNAFKEKLSLIKDTRKKTIVDKVDTHIQEIETKRTTQMNEALTRLTTILDRVSTKVTTTTPQSSKDLISTARMKIETAKTAVETQKNKDYVIQITTDASLAQAVKATLQTFTTDIRTTHQTVVDARSAVIEAIKSLEPKDVAPPTTIEETTNL